MPQRSSDGRIDLKPTQERVLAALKEDGLAQLTRGQYEEIAGVSRSQAAYDLAELVEVGILERIGGGRSTRYRVARRDRPGQRRWTNEKIRAALEAFCEGRTTWPSASEFKAAGHADLYVAASRYGGVGFWARELGFERNGRGAPPPRERRSWKLPTVQLQTLRVTPRMRWAGALGVLAAGVFALGGAAFFAEHQKARPTAAPHTRHASLAKKEANAPRPTRKTAPVKKNHVAKAKPTRTQVTRRVRVTAPPPPPPPAARSHTGAQLAVARSTPPVQTTSASQPTHTSTPRSSTPTPSTSSSGPTPLPAPSGGSGGPGPLPPPKH